MVAKGFLEPGYLLSACPRRGPAWLERAEMNAERPNPGPAWQNGCRMVAKSLQNGGKMDFWRWPLQVPGMRESVERLRESGERIVNSTHPMNG